MIQISETENLLFRAMEQIRFHKTAIYGAGVRADRLCAWLLDQGVCPAACLVDPQYYKGGTVRGIPVHPLDSFCEANRRELSEMVLIIALAGFEEARFAYGDAFAGIVCCDLEGMFTLGEENSMSRAFVDEHRSELRWLEEHVGDARSEEALSNFIDQKISGRYRTPFEPDQYFPQDLISFSDKEVFIDCGAYTGDTVLQFVRALEMRGIPAYRSILAFEPDGLNQAAFLENTAGLTGIELFPGGVYSESGQMSFSGDKGTSSRIAREGQNTIRVYSIDDVYRDRTPDTFIKMDVEGSEMEALKGARETIRAVHPTLAVSVYHKNADFFEIPRYVLSLYPAYKLYFRKHSPSATELVLYAIP